MNYKIVFIDIDGTLITSNLEITEGTLEAVKRVYHEQHVPVVLTSARPVTGVSPIYNQLGFKSPTICFNGALVIDEKGNPIVKHELRLKDVKLLTELIEQYNIVLNVYDDQYWFATRIDEHVEREEEVVKMQAHHMNINQLIDMANVRPIYKVLLMGNENIIDKLYSKLQDNKEFGHLNISRSKPTYIEIISGNTSKANAIEEILKRYGINPQEAMGIGDNFNDADMLKTLGKGIAMDNSPEKIKDIADELTASNDEDGVKQALDKYFPPE